MNSISPAYAWGKEDGLEGKSEFTGYDYFAGANLQEYFEGHRQGVAMRQRLQGVVLGEVKRLAGGSDAKPLTDEQVMDAELDAMRNHGKQPIVRMTDAQMYEIERERVGG